MPVEAVQVVGAVGLVRPDAPLGVGRGVEDVEHVERRFERLGAELEHAANLQLQVFGIVIADLAVAASCPLEPQPRGQRIGLRQAVGQAHGGRTELRHLGIVGIEAHQQRADEAARLDHVAAANADAPRRQPLPADPHREGPVGCSRLAAAAVQRVVVAVAEELLRQVAVVGERIRLHEAGRIGRVPRAGQVLPLPRGAGNHLEAVRHVLGEGHLDGVHDHARPGVVGLLGDDAAVGIDQAEAAERLPGPRRIDAVDVHLGEVVLVAALRGGHADADLPWELAVVADRELVEVGLVQVLVEQQIGIDAARRRREHRGTVARLVDVDVGRVHGPERAEGHDVVAPVHLFIESSITGADDVARVFGDQVREADARLHRRALLPVDAQDLVVALDEVHPQADIGGEPGRRGE